MWKCADWTPAVATGDLDTDCVDVSLGPISITEGLVASATRPSLGAVVEVRLRSAADDRARRAWRGGCRR